MSLTKALVCLLYIKQIIGIIAMGLGRENRWVLHEGIPNFFTGIEQSLPGVKHAVSD